MDSTNADQSHGDARRRGCDGPGGRILLFRYDEQTASGGGGKLEENGGRRREVITAVRTAVKLRDETIQPRYDASTNDILWNKKQNTHTHTFIKITHQTCVNKNITDETTKQ